MITNSLQSKYKAIGILNKLNEISLMVYKKFNSESFLILTMLIASNLCKQKNCIYINTLKCLANGQIQILHDFYVALQYNNNVFRYCVENKKERGMILKNVIHKMQVDSCQIIDVFLNFFCSTNAVLTGVVKIFTVFRSLEGNISL